MIPAPEALLPHLEVRDIRRPPLSTHIEGVFEGWGSWFVTLLCFASHFTSKEHSFCPSWIISLMFWGLPVRTWSMRKISYKWVGAEGKIRNCLCWFHPDSFTHPVIHSGVWYEHPRHCAEVAGEMQVIGQLWVLPSRSPTTTTEDSPRAAVAKQKASKCKRKWWEFTALRGNIQVPCWLGGKESTCQCRRRAFSPWVGKTPWRRK